MLNQIKNKNLTRGSELFSLQSYKQKTKYTQLHLQSFNLISEHPLNIFI